jgi:hypothetical protein
MAEVSTAHAAAKKPTPPVSGPLASLEAWLYEMLVVKAPFQLPKEITNFIVQYGPWITLVVGILLLPAVLAVLGIGALVGSYASFYGTQVGLFYWLAIVALIVQLAFMFISIPMLLKRQRNGWLLLFYAGLFNFVYAVLNSLSTPYAVLGGIFAAVIGLVIGQYVLFQIRSHYTK